MAKQNCVNQSVTANGVQVANSAGIGTVSTVLSDGQLLIGATGAAPVAATLTAGAGISITPGSGSLTITNTGGGGGGGISSVTGANGLEATTVAGAVTVGVKAVSPTIAADGNFALTMDPSGSQAGSVNLFANGSSSTTNGPFIQLSANANDGTGANLGSVILFGGGGANGGGRVSLQAQGADPVASSGTINLSAQGGGTESGCINVAATSDEGQDSGKVLVTVFGSDGLNSGQFVVQATGSTGDNSGNISFTTTTTDPTVNSGIFSVTTNGQDNQVFPTISGQLNLQAFKSQMNFGCTAAAGVTQSGLINIASEGSDAADTGCIKLQAQAMDGTAARSGQVTIDALGIDGGPDTDQGVIRLESSYGRIDLIASESTGIANSGRVNSQCPLRITQSFGKQPFSVLTGAQKGTATLVNGIVTVNNAWVTTSNVIVATHQTTSGSIGHLKVEPGTGDFTITSVKSNNTTETDDQSTVQYWIM